MTTPVLGIEELILNQSQPHVTVNEAIRTLEVAAQLRVLDKDLAAPPASPATNARYIVAAGATGAWAGQAGKVAFNLSGAWTFLAPESGWLAYVVDEAAIYQYSGSAWAELVLGGGGGGSPSDLAVAGPGSPTVLISPVSSLLFANATVADLGGGSVLVTPDAGGGGGGGSPTVLDIGAEWSEYDDLIIDDLIGGYDGDQSSTGSITWDVAIAGRPGVVQLSSNAATATSVGFTKGARTLATQKAKLLPGGGVLTFRAIARMSTLLVGVETGQGRIGFMDEISGAPTNAIHLQYEAIGGNWILYCRNGSPSSADTGIAVDTNWHLFEIVVNAGGTSVQAYIDGVAAGSPVTGNIPSAGFTWGAQVQKTAGTTPLTMQVDAFQVGQVFSARRY